MQTKGVALLPKSVCSVMDCEVTRCMRLGANIIEPIKLTAPRKNKAVFHVDLFPDTYAGEPALSAQQWIEGGNADPILKPVRRSVYIIFSVAKYVH